MLLDTLVTIGEQIAEEEYETEYAACCDPDSLRGNQTIETVVELEFQRDDDTLRYNGYRIVDPTDPLDMAIRYGYVNQYNQYDHSLTQRASSDLTKELSRLLNWPSDEGLGDVREHSFIQSLNKTFDTYEDEISKDIEAIADEIDYKALLTLRFLRDGRSKYPGNIEPVMKGTFNAYKEGLHTSSSATESTGESTCSVCDRYGTVYGLGAQIDAMYAFKKQWPFPEYNASRSWQSRPLCETCIRHIETATKLFLDRQNFGAPGVRCRIIPYALPVEGGDERLRQLVQTSREQLTDDETERPLGAAWDIYRKRVDVDVDNECLRLSFVHYKKDSNKSHGVAYIDGVSVDRFTHIKKTFNDVVEMDELGVFSDSRQPKKPTEKSLFTGMWLHWLLCEESDSDHTGDRIGDSDQWATLTENLLTKRTISYSDVVSAVVTEAIERVRAQRQSSDSDEYQPTNYPYDGQHIAAAYAFLRLINEMDILNDSRTDHSMQHEQTTGDYTTFGDGLLEFITAHSSIDQSPGRTAAFILGALAERLSAWQKRRDLNRTFIQNRSISGLTTDSMIRWQRDIWEKSKTYNSQEGNYGVPWSVATERFHEAVLEGKETGWNATKEELQYHYILGTTVGPTINAQARENARETDSTNESQVEAPDTKTATNSN